MNKKFDTGNIVKWDTYLSVKAPNGGRYDKKIARQGRITSYWGVEASDGEVVNMYSVKDDERLTSHVIPENGLCLVRLK